MFSGTAGKGGAAKSHYHNSVVPSSYLLKNNNYCFSVDIAYSVLVNHERIIRTVLKSNLGGGPIFRRRPDRAWGPPTLLYNGHRVSFPGVQRPGSGSDHPPTSSVEVKQRVELYLYSPSGPSWPVLK